MKIDTAGNYTLRYSAEDSCGNKTLVDRSVVVVPPRTVLYSDGTFIINELAQDRTRNEQLHGAATNEYIPFDPNGDSPQKRYVFGDINLVPWKNETSLIKHFIIGSDIYPTQTAWWLSHMDCESMDFTKLRADYLTSIANMFAKYDGQTVDISTLGTHNVTDMGQMFTNANSIVTLDLSTLDTSNATRMTGMFFASSNGSALKTIDLSSFDTSNVTDMEQMFNHRSNLQTIYASVDFITTQVSNSANMFAYCNRLVGGGGTPYNSSNPRDKTYARIDNPPDAPGYFTLKTA